MHGSAVNAEIFPPDESGGRMSKTRIPEVKEVYRIIDRATGEAEGVYSRACHDEYDFESASAALHANCHGIHKNSKKYKIAKYRVIYELIEDDCKAE